MVNLNKALKTAHNTIERYATGFLESIEDFISEVTKPETSAEILGTFAEHLLHSKLEKIKQQLESKIAKIDKTFESVIRTLEANFGLLPALYGGKECTYPPHLLQDPYITGFYFVTIVPPTTIINQVKFNSLKFRQKLGFLCRDVQLPTIIINHVEKQGYGGTKQQIVSNVDYDKTISLTFYDTYDLEIHKFFKAWALSIVDTKTGMHTYKYQTDFKSTVVVVHADPKFNAIDLDVFVGAHPSQVPLISQSRDNTIREAQITMTFDLWSTTRKS